MEKRNLIKHLEYLDETVVKITIPNVFAFGASCLERQLSVYERASKGKLWSKQKVLRETLDLVWAWILQNKKSPIGYLEVIEKAVPDEIEDDNATYAGEIVDSFCSLLYGIEENLPLQCASVAGQGLEVIEMFLYDLLDVPVTSENDLRIDRHDLIISEIENQKKDLQILLDKNIVDVSILKYSQNKSLLKNLWYE